MGKLYLNYKKHNDSQLGDILKIKIDDTITAEVNKNEIYEIELTEGNHNIKMYYEGWTNDEQVGYIDENIEINGNTYYTYKGPVTIYGKGTLKKESYNNSEEFKTSITKSNKTFKIIEIILIVLAILIILFL